MSVSATAPVVVATERLLLALLDSLRHDPVGTRPGKATLRGRWEKWSEALGLASLPPETTRPLLVTLLELTERLGLAQPRHGYLRPCAKPARALFGQQGHERCRALLTAWEAGPVPGGWASTLLATGAGDALPSSDSRARSWLLSRLGEVARDPRRPRTKSLCARLEREGGDRPGEQWRTALTTLAGLGVLDADAFARGEVATTSEGAFVLGCGPRPAGGGAAETTERVLVQPSFQLVALTAPGSLGLLHELGRFARPEGPPPNFSYHMDAVSLSRGASEGFTPGAVLRLLGERCPYPLPQNVEHSVGAWGQAQRRAQVHRGATLLEFDSAAELDERWPELELSAGTSRVGPTRAVGATAQRGALAHALGSNAFEDLDHGGRLAPSLSLTATMDVGVDETRLGLRAMGVLRALGASPAGEGQWTLDAALAGRRLSGGTEAARRLRKQAHEAFTAGLPPELRVAAAAARGGLGQPQLLEGVVLLCPDEPSTNLLLSLPSVRARALQRVGDRAVLVAPEDAQPLRELLAGLGLDCANGRPAAGGLASGPEEAGGEGGNVLESIRLALRRDWELLLRFDPGARRPEELLRVRPIRLTERGRRHVLHATAAGQPNERSLPLAFVRSARVLPPPDEL